MLCLSGCGLFASSPPAEPETIESPAAASDAAEPETIEPDPPPIPVPDNVQVYQEPNGMFALALPQGYRFEPVEQGLTFLSEDGGFAGEIIYQVSDGPSNDMLNLEKALKSHIEPQFSTIEWQKVGQRQPDSSVRLAWTGEDEDGRAIDALSFIEVHGQTTFILSLYAIDQAYNTYSEDARIIAGTYVVRKNEVSAEESEEGAEEGAEESSTEDASEEKEGGADED
ncbi:MAG: hypothetical protein VKJ64_17330 [Leptolyngbyaceae bacterium]|nr:hypothetical protein [Leptolyngbyaceae bacterium]